MNVLYVTVDVSDDITMAIATADILMYRFRPGILYDQVGSLYFVVIYTFMDGWWGIGCSIVELSTQLLTFSTWFEFDCFAPIRINTQSMIFLSLINVISLFSMTISIAWFVSSEFCAKVCQWISHNHSSIFK